MNKVQKRQIEECVQTLRQAHEEVMAALGRKDCTLAGNMLSQCQEFAVSMGESIEQTEGEGHAVVSRLEEYCETLFHIYEKISGGSVDELKIAKQLKKQLIKVENSVRNDIRTKREAVFLPYKASMWDSLESVWKAADEDPDCDAYVIPIPYYDKNPDGSLGQMHYEGDRYPAYVPVTRYDDFDLTTHRPEMVFIHNPYDMTNLVTSVHPDFYSENLKRYTDCLIYVPYYATAGAMAEGQGLCSAYIHADYIVIQAEKYRGYFDARIPDEKFLAFGSPKFDSVINKCKNPPEPPRAWAEKMAGRKVYFYNTSINGMLGDTEVFLNKMRYVFDIFKGREDACLLWRPHPLLESTFDSMRPMFKAQYAALKREFLEENAGIYDDTSDMESSIALSDAYIGDSATSVTSMFGVAGKPLFILNNYIHTLPEKDDWRGEKINPQFDMWGNDRYQVSAANQLWYSENNDYHYRFYMDLGCGYASGGYYTRAVEIRGRIYVIPCNAQHLLVIENKKIRKLELAVQMAKGGAFRGYWYNGKYIFLLPNQYPYLVRFNLDTEKFDYMDGIRQFNVRFTEGEWRIGGFFAPYGNEIIFASPEDSRFLFMDMDTFKTREVCCASGSNPGVQGITEDPYDRDWLWLTPLNGMTLTCWNPKTGEKREYGGGSDGSRGSLPEGYKCMKWPYETECRERPFCCPVFSRDSGRENIIIPPAWGNMYLTLNRETGEMREWKPPMGFATRGKNAYFRTGGAGGFATTLQQMGKAEGRLWYSPERRLYEINIDTGAYREVEIDFDYEELRAHEPGFAEDSEWMQYCIKENAWNSLKDFLDGNITGAAFSRERQIKAFSRINASPDGTCGKRVYEFAKGKVDR